MAQPYEGLRLVARVVGWSFRGRLGRDQKMNNHLETEIIGHARVTEYHELTARLRTPRTVEDGQRARAPRRTHIAILQRVVPVLLRRVRALQGCGGAG